MVPAHPLIYWQGDFGKCQSFRPLAPPRQSCSGYHCTHHLLIKRPRCDINTAWPVKEPHLCLCSLAREREGVQLWELQALWALSQLHYGKQGLPSGCTLLLRSLSLLLTSQNLFRSKRHLVLIIQKVRNEEADDSHEVTREKGVHLYWGSTPQNWVCSLLLIYSLRVHLLKQHL